PTQAAGKRPAARRVFAEKAVWLRCSSVEDPPGIFSFVAPRHPAFSAKTAPSPIFRQALTLFTRRYYHDCPRKMKPTVGLTTFFRLINLCEKNAVSTNVYSHSVIFKKMVFCDEAKKLFVLQRKDFARRPRR